MNLKQTYTKVFLKQAGIAITEATLKEYMPLWWQNTRDKKEGGLRLTPTGFDFLIEKLDLRFYEVPYPKDKPITTQTIIFLDKFINCPYFLSQIPSLKNSRILNPKSQISNQNIKSKISNHKLQIPTPEPQIPNLFSSLNYF